MNKLPIYNCIIDNEDDTTGIYAISFVDCPANEVDFVTLNKQAVHLNRDSQKQILTGVVLQPEQLIYRQSPQMGEYYIKFSADEIEKISHKMMRQSLALYNTTHQHEQCLSGNYLVELWIIENPGIDKSRALGFKDLPKGTLMCSYKIDDRNYWDSQVMTGNVKGFSLEGFFNQVSMAKIKNNRINNKLKMNRKKSILDRLASLLLTTEEVIKKDATKSGEPYVLFVLADSNEVYVDQDGFATLNEEQMPAGEHALADGSLLVVDEEGLFVETKAPSEKKDDKKEAVAPETMRKHIRLNEFEPKTAEAVKAKIAAMQDIIDELATALDEANQLLTSTNEEVEELKKRTPSAQPLKQKNIFRTPENLSMAERMAVMLNQTIDRRK